MDLFEILIILAFVLFPILEQVLKRRKRSGPDQPGPDPMEPEPGEIGPPSSRREPVKASDMVPDDLWAVLTGEQRPTEGVETADPREPATEPPRRLEQAPSPLERGPEPAPERWEEAWTPRPEPRSRLEEGTPEPVSLEEHGPEAYSLEGLDHPARSLERPLQSPTARHRAFHEQIGGPRPRRRPKRSALGRALRSPDSLRQAFVLTEVLGPPKGLE